MTNVSELNATLSLLYNERTKGYDINELISPTRIIEECEYIIYRTKQ